VDPPGALAEAVLATVGARLDVCDLADMGAGLVGRLAVGVATDLVAVEGHATLLRAGARLGEPVVVTYRRTLDGQAKNVSSQAQIAITQEFFQKCFYGNVADAVALLDDRVTYTVPGTHQLAGTFQGPESVAEHVGNLLKLTCGTVDVTQWEDWLTGIDHVGALVQMRVQRTGQVNRFRSVYMVTVTEENKIRTIELFFGDQSAIERFFAH
jgi:ketosteroid isomerase-like protein